MRMIKAWGLAKGRTASFHGGEKRTASASGRRTSTLSTLGWTAKLSSWTEIWQVPMSMAAKVPSGSTAAIVESDEVQVARRSMGRSLPSEYWPRRRSERCSPRTRLNSNWAGRRDWSTGGLGIGSGGLLGISASTTSGTSGVSDCVAGACPGEKGASV